MMLHMLSEALVYAVVQIECVKCVRVSVATAQQQCATSRLIKLLFTILDV